MLSIRLSFQSMQIFSFTKPVKLYLKSIIAKFFYKKRYLGRFFAARSIC